MDSVTIVTHNPIRNGGTERVVHTLCRSLRRAGTDADVLLLVKDSDRVEAEITRQVYLADDVPTRIAVSDTHRKSLLFGNIANFLTVFRSVSSKTINIHYAATVNASLSQVIAARLAGKRCVISLHHPMTLVDLSWRKRIAAGMSLRLASQVVVDTEYTRELLLNDLPGTVDIKVIALGVSLPAPATESRDSVRKRLGIPTDAFVVGFLGRLVDYKGLMLVIRAVAKLNDPSMFLLVAGTGPDGAGMQQEAKQLLGERALFLGAVPDSDLFYRTLDVFAMPSTLESFGIVYVEAALRGVPSVASPTGGVPYVVAHGESGLMVDKTVDGVAAALYRLRADPAFAKALGKQARRRALEEFSDTAMAEHYRDLFNCKHSIIP